MSKSDNKIQAFYISVWEEGEIETEAFLNTVDYKVSTESVDVGEEYEHHIEDYLEITYKGKNYTLDCEHGQLSTKSLEFLQRLLQNN